MNPAGLVIEKQPDPNLAFNETTGDWSFTEPDWDEFYQVIRGKGPENDKRVALRRFSHEQGLWVRKAIASGSTSVPPAA